MCWCDRSKWGMPGVLEVWHVHRVWIGGTMPFRKMEREIEQAYQEKKPWADKQECAAIYERRIRADILMLYHIVRETNGQVLDRHRQSARRS